MKQIIPFTKDITFKTKIGELTSISLDNDLTLKGEDLITGNFYIKGSYKMIKTSELEEEYSYKIPCDIAISDEYETFDATIDIDDFNYEIINEEILRVKISVEIDNLTKKEVPEKELVLTREEPKEEIKPIKNEVNSLEERCIEPECHTPSPEKKEVKVDIIAKNDTSSEERDIDPLEIIKETKPDIVALNSEEETYSTYSVYLVREEDTIESILERYKVSLLELSDYNDTSSVVAGTKLIIPSSND